MPSSAPVRLTAVDAHAAGGVLRLVTGGFPVPRGRTLYDKARWLARRHEGLCSALTLEPRGHDGIVLAVLCEPSTAGADAGVLFRHAGGFVPLCGHGLIATATIAVAFDVVADADRDRVVRVRYTSPPSFVFAGAVPVPAGARVVRADVAFGGAEFLLIADSE